MAHPTLQVEAPREPGGAPAIVVRDLVKSYPGPVRALDGVSFEVAAGNVFALLGPNGAGKTTLVRILTTLARADAGSARVAGADVGSEPDRVRRSIGVVAQRSGADPNATGRENLVLQGRLFGLRGRELEQRSDALLRTFGLADAAKRLVSGYSGGMQRRLDVALALVHRPSVLLLDEPTTGLDPEIRLALWTEIRRLSRTEGLTVLLTTHYLEEADRLADRLVILDAGRIVAAGTPAELKAELRGDAIAVDLRDGGARDGIAAALGPVPAVELVGIEDRRVHLRVADGPRTLPAVLGALEAGGIAVDSATVSRPSLDDVYLHHAGRSFEAAATKEMGALR
jgi:ABC-2 type transport system ATP-binding protein